MAVSSGGCGMKKWNMIVDVERCENCYNCFIATKDEHVGNDFPGYAAPQPDHGHNWIKMETKERGSAPMVEANFMPTMCNHCDDAPCMKVAENGAVTKRSDGIVLIDPVKSKGQKQIVDACPYGAVYWNEERQIPQKWIFDAHLLDNGWTRTRAEQACPTGALKSIKTEDAAMKNIASQEGLEVLKPELNTKPRVYYKNLHLMTSLFIGGTVTCETNDDAVEDAEVTLSQGGRVIATTRTDAFGDFKIDGLSAENGSFEVSIKHAKGQFTSEVDISESRYIGLCPLN